MKKLVLVLVGAIAVYAYVANGGSLTRDVKNAVSLAKKGGQQLVDALPNESQIDQAGEEWSHSFDQALNNFDWSSLPSGDKLLNGLEKSLKQFGHTVKQTKDLEVRHSLKNEMDNLILKVETIDYSHLSKQQQQRFNTLLNQAQKLKQEI